VMLADLRLTVVALHATTAHGTGAALDATLRRGLASAPTATRKAAWFRELYRPRPPQRRRSGWARSGRSA
jgi:hypothetical protein